MNEEQSTVSSTFRSRHLQNDEDVFSHNAWDDVEWDKETEEKAKALVSANSSDVMSDRDQEVLEEKAGEFWNSFYSKHQRKFFKDRSWISLEFPELFTPTSGGERFILDIGCGVGNTTIPLLKSTQHLNCMVFACDLSQNAIEILKQAPEYDASRCLAFQFDLTCSESLPSGAKKFDFILLIFVLSSINPRCFKSTLARLADYLKPGGMILFRDYGQYDMAQLRFKKGKCLSDNFYARSDGTRAYFFKQEEIRSLFTSVGLEEVQNIVDRRLIVNRKRLLKMYRVWMQCKYRKPFYH